MSYYADIIFRVIGFSFCVVGGASLAILVLWALIEKAVKSLRCTMIVARWYAEKLRARKAPPLSPEKP